MPWITRAATIGVLCAAATVIAPGSALASADEGGFVAALKKPAVVDGVRLNAKQVKQRFAGQELFFVLGSREEGDGAAAAFTTRAKRDAYLRKTGRSPESKRHGARASYNGYESWFYRDPFLEGPAIRATSNSALGNLGDYAMWWFGPSFDNQISSAKTGYWGARLYDYPFLSTAGGTVDIPAYDSVELWRYFDDRTSSIWNY